MEKLSDVKSFGGRQMRFKHRSAVLGCDMIFAVYLPPQAETGKVPVLWYLSGLTCTDENFVNKAGAQRYAAARGIALVAPDTSPRGIGIAGEDESWDFGTGAGFYLDATKDPWSGSYRMYSYVVDELPKLVFAELPLLEAKQSITGHSMGGHGALTIALKNPGRFQSCSAFAPICNPMDCPWGHKAFGGYLASKDEGSAYDACALVSAYQGPDLHLLVDQGSSDSFLKEQLKPEALQAACAKAGVALELRMQDGYDHSYFFISSFIGDHIDHHAKFLV